MTYGNYDIGLGFQNVALQIMLLGLSWKKKIYIYISNKLLTRNMQFPEDWCDDIDVFRIINNFRQFHEVPSKQHQKDIGNLWDWTEINLKLLCQKTCDV